MADRGNVAEGGSAVGGPQRSRIRGALSGVLVTYLLVTGVICLLTWHAAGRLLQQGDPVVAATVVAAAACVLAAFWWNGCLGGSRRWWAAYPLVQSLLVLVLFVATRVVAHVNVSLPESVLLCLAGEALGTWGNTRRGFALAGAYLAAAAGAVVLFTPAGEWAGPLNQLGLIAATLVVLMVLYNRADAERLRAEALTDELRSANERVAALTLQAERQRMARELHDTLAQGLAGLTLQLEATRGHLDHGNVARAASIVEHALTGARATLAASRQAIDDLRRNPDDLASEIGARAARFNRETGIRSTVEISGEVALAPETREHLLRVLDEALANVARHAGADHVLVQFADGEERLLLQVTDDGDGFDPDAVGEGHYGLMGMRERAALVGGGLLVDSRPGRTAVRLEIAR